MKTDKYLTAFAGELRLGVGDKRAAEIVPSRWPCTSQWRSV